MVKSILLVVAILMTAHVSAQVQPTSVQRGQAFVVANGTTPFMVITFSEGSDDGPVGEAYMLELPGGVKPPSGLKGVAEFEFRKAEHLYLSFKSGKRIAFVERPGGAIPAGAELVTVAAFERLGFRPKQPNHAEAAAYLLQEFKSLPRRKTPASRDAPRPPG